MRIFLSYIHNFRILMLDQFVLLYNLAYLEKIESAGSNKLSHMKQVQNIFTKSLQTEKQTTAQLFQKSKHIFI